MWYQVIVELLARTLSGDDFRIDLCRGLVNTNVDRENNISFT